jgi:hypothetical protein
VPVYPYTSHEVVIEAATPNATWKDVGGGAAALGPPTLSRHDLGGTVLQQAVPLAIGFLPSGSSSLRWESVPPFAFQAEAIAVAQVDPPACGTACDATAQYTIRFYETTGVIPRFNNSGSQTTVLLLQNPVTADSGDGTHLITGHINFYTGGPATPPVQVPFQILENSGLVLNTATVAPGVAGRITVTHNGRYGQLVGKATAVEPATGFSFDTPLSNLPH